MFTDSHCHLASHQFPPEEIPTLLQRAKENNIHRIITLSTSLQDIETNIKLADQHPQIHATIGIHPCDVHNTPDNYLQTLKQFITHPKCCAIGETGLDYFHPAPQNWTTENYHAKQRNLLHQHFQLAAEHNKNIVIHTRDQPQQKTGTPPLSLQHAVEIYSQYAHQVTAVFHCFLGPWNNPHVQTILDLGGYLSYTGITTFKKATETLEAATLTPPDRIMLETDAPYLAPTPHRGKRNEPSFTLHTAKTIATARGITLQELATITEQNVNRFFKLQNLTEVK